MQSPSCPGALRPGALLVLLLTCAAPVAAAPSPSDVPPPPPAQGVLPPGGSARGGGLAGEGELTTPAPRPNILLIVADDLGWGDLGVQGDPFIQTPTIDALAAEGARLTQFSAGAPSCSPTRIGVLTGSPPVRFGFQQPSKNTSRRGVPSDVFTLPELLGTAGYVTGHVGKWHLGEDFGELYQEFLPLGVGFDASARLLIPTKQTHWDLPVELDDATDAPQTGHSTDVVTAHALDFLEEHAGGEDPFFLNVWYYAPHLPMQVPAEWLDAYVAAGADPTDPWTVFAAMVTHMDDGVRQLLEKLDALGVRDDTLVVFTSDNGGALNPGLHPDGNGGLKGGKSTVYEGGLRVPFVASWPGVIPAGVVNDSFTTAADLLPTFRGVSGATGTPQGLGGRDLLPALLSPALQPRETPLCWSAKTSAQKVTPASGILETFAVRLDRRAKTGRDWKLVFDDDVTQLHDLASDPAETTDLSAEFPGMTQALWDAWWQDRRARAEFPWYGMPVGHVKGLGGPTGAAGTPHFFAGGVLRLFDDARFDMHDGHFSATLELRTDQVGAQAILVKCDSFELALDETNVPVLTVHGDDGSTLVLRGQDPLVPGEPHRLAFTIVRWPSPLTDNDVTLYVGGQVQDAGTVPAVAPNRNTTLVGNDAPPPYGLRPFSGVIRDLRFSLVALTQEEVQGGWPAVP